jgi:tRNA pseudouridine13 synthase
VEFKVTSVKELACVAGDIPTSGIIKSDTSDFLVDEIMPVQPSGEGEHLWLHVRKTGNNTDWVARQLAAWANVKPMDVGYAGLKDRHGVTSQWYSIQLPGKADPDMAALNIEGVEVLQHKRHNRKLKRGTLAGNRFDMTVRELKGDTSELQARLVVVQQQGVPNYFGEQRFGHSMSNLPAAERMFNGERVKQHERSLYLSAARSWIFNQVLNQRVRAHNWNTHVPGDVFMLDGRSACFADDNSAEIDARLAALAIHPTGPLWGGGISMAQSDCLLLENNVAQQFPAFCSGLEKFGMDQERRSLRLRVNDLKWRIEDNVLHLSFSLPAGSYCVKLFQVKK